MTTWQQYYSNDLPWRQQFTFKFKQREYCFFYANISVVDSTIMSVFSENDVLLRWTIENHECVDTLYQVIFDVIHYRSVRCCASNWQPMDFEIVNFADKREPLSMYTDLGVSFYVIHGNSMKISIFNWIARRCEWSTINELWIYMK